MSVCIRKMLYKSTQVIYADIAHRLSVTRKLHPSQITSDLYWQRPCILAQIEACTLDVGDCDQISSYPAGDMAVAS